MSPRNVLRLLAALLAVAGTAYAGQASFGSTSSGPQTYVVQPGDSLWSISQADGVTMQALAAANGMQLSDVLDIGRHLVIPTSSPGAGTSPTTPSSSSAPQQATTLTQGTNSCGVTPTAAPSGVLPSVLAAAPERLALRPLFNTWSNYYDVQPSLVEAIAWQESGWQESVISPDGAVGIGQLMPATTQFVSQLVGIVLNPTSAYDNIRMTARYLAWLASQENGSPCRTIAAYYEGPTNLANSGVLSVTVPYLADVEALIPRFQ